MLRLAAAVAGVTIAVGVVLATAAPAGAHTELVSSAPAPGASVGPEVTTIRLTFTTVVSAAGSVIELVPATGATVPLEVRGAADPRSLTAPVPPGLAGAYTVRWAAASADGHLAEGTFGLGFGGVAAPAAVGAPVADRHAPTLPGADEVATARRALTVGRTATYLGLTVLVGGWLFLAVVWAAGAGTGIGRSVLWVGWALAATGTAVGYGAQAAVLRRDLGAAVDPAAWRALLELPFGRAWAARGALVVLAVPVLRALARGGEVAVRAAWWRVAAAAVGVGLLRTPGFVAHASEGDRGAIGSAADLVHLLGIAAWMGGLVMLCAAVLPRRRAQELAAVVPRFSRVAMVAMAAIVLGGAALSWQLLDGVDGLWSTEFGRVLLTKLVVFTAALGAAQCSRRWVEGRFRPAVAGAAQHPAVRPFVVSVTAEVVLGVAVLALASTLVGTSPGA